MVNRTLKRKHNPPAHFKQVPPTPRSTGPPSVQALFEKAQTLFIEFQYDLAILFLNRVLETDSKHAEARELLGFVLLASGNRDAAKEAFLLLTPPPLLPHLFLLRLPMDDLFITLNRYQAAVHVLTRQLNDKIRAHSHSNIEISRKLTHARVGAVEMWLKLSNSLGFSLGVDDEYEDLLKFALETDPGNPKALQVLASMRISQQRPDDAKVYLKQAWETLKDLGPSDPRHPSISDSFALARLFVKVGLYKPALLIVDRILTETKETKYKVEAWYIKGLCLNHMAEHAQEIKGKVEKLTWRELAGGARDCLRHCEEELSGFDTQGYPVKILQDHMKDIIRKLEAQGVTPSSAEEERRLERGLAKLWRK